MSSHCAVPGWQHCPPRFLLTLSPGRWRRHRRRHPSHRHHRGRDHSGPTEAPPRHRRPRSSRLHHGGVQHRLRPAAPADCDVSDGPGHLHGGPIHQARSQRAPGCQRAVRQRRRDPRHLGDPGGASERGGGLRRPAAIARHREHRGHRRGSRRRWAWNRWHHHPGQRPDSSKAVTLVLFTHGPVLARLRSSTARPATPPPTGSSPTSRRCSRSRSEWVCRTRAVEHRRSGTLVTIHRR